MGCASTGVLRALKNNNSGVIFFVHLSLSRCPSWGMPCGSVECGYLPWGQRAAPLARPPAQHNERKCGTALCIVIGGLVPSNIVLLCSRKRYRRTAFLDKISLVIGPAVFPTWTRFVLQQEWEVCARPAIVRPCPSACLFLHPRMVFHFPWSWSLGNGGFVGPLKAGSQPGHARYSRKWQGW